MKSKTKRRAQKGKQRVKKRYAKAREDAQLEGLIDTAPAGAVRDERVAPATQGDQPLPGVIGAAIRKGWATPEDRKPRLVDEMVGIVENFETPAPVKVMAYNALRAGDKDQWERDNPELSGKTKGSTNVAVGVKVEQQIDLAALLDAVDARMERAKKLGEVDVIAERTTVQDDLSSTPVCDQGSVVAAN